MLQRILQRILQVCFHQVTGSLIIAGTVGVVDTVVHLVDSVLGSTLGFVKIGKNSQLAAELFCGVSQAAVLAVIIKEQMKAVGVLDPKGNIRFIELFFFFDQLCFCKDKLGLTADLCLIRPCGAVELSWT